MGRLQSFHEKPFSRAMSSSAVRKRKRLECEKNSGES